MADWQEWRLGIYIESFLFLTPPPPPPFHHENDTYPKASTPSLTHSFIHSFIQSLNDYAIDREAGDTGYLVPIHIGETTVLASCW